MPDRIVVDTSKFVADMKRFESRMTPAVRDTARTECEHAAERIRSKTPVDSGALVGTIEVVSTGSDSYGITYGGGLQYAWIQAARSGNLKGSVGDTRTSFQLALSLATAREVSRV